MSRRVRVCQCTINADHRHAPSVRDARLGYRFFHLLLPACMGQNFHYLRRFVAAPAQIGSIAPSSKALTRAMVRYVDWGRADTIVELGAGTGVFTRAIDSERRRDSRFFVFEKESGLQSDLRRQFPDAEVHADAFQLRETLDAAELAGADCILSGLPFANFPPALRSALIDDVYRCLNPGGMFIAFQYSLQLRRELKRRFRALDLDVVFRNMPPAVVYRCRSVAVATPPPPDADAVYPALDADPELATTVVCKPDHRDRPR